MPGYHDLALDLAQRIAGGDPVPGRALPSVREVARQQGTTAATVARAYAELARVGVVATSPRRAARVAPDGVARARQLVSGGGDAPLRLAGSDDPALDLLLGGAAGVDRVAGGRGSAGGLGALWRGDADAAALHLWHASGDHNAPYAGRVLAGRGPLLVRLWRREQGIVVPPGNPAGVRHAGNLERLVVARRAVGTGTHALTERLLRDRGVDPGALRGFEAGSHLGAAAAVAAEAADAGLAVRAAATLVGADFVPLAWEPFELAVPEDRLGGLAPLLERLVAGDTGRRIEALGGYDLDGAGAIRRVA